MQISAHMPRLARAITSRLLMAAAAIYVAAAPVARAEFSVCNKTQHASLVAIGLIRAGNWSSEGWWRIEPQQCKVIVKGTLRARYYYLRAVHVGVEGDWEGNRYFCVTAKNFSIKGRKGCIKRGYGQSGFFEVDTGTKLTWVQNLSD
ncbi:MAG: DUF1036 domain-containing protein [Micropepsaceae bacterium]